MYELKLEVGYNQLFFRFEDYSAMCDFLEVAIKHSADDGKELRTTITYRNKDEEK